MTEEKKPTGRPSSYTPELADEICSRLSEGEPLVTIYALCEADTGEIRYIGKANDARKRFASHLRDARRRNTPVYSWLRSRLAEGRTPVLRTLATVHHNDWPNEEKRLIVRHKSPRLLNIAEGGDQPFCPDAVRAENGRANAMRIHSDPKRKRLWYLTQQLSYRLSNATGALYKKTLLNCMAMADLYPQIVPASWQALRWDTEALGELNKDVIRTHMSKRLMARLDFTNVYA